VQITVPIHYQINFIPQILLYKAERSMALYPNTSTSVEAEEAWTDFLNENMIYPPSALKNKVDGRVRVECVIDANGILFSPKIHETDSDYLNEEALRLVGLVENEGRWVPSQFLEESINTVMILDIYFDRKAWKKQQRSKK